MAVTSISPSVQDLIDQGKAEAQLRRPDLKFADGDVSEADLHVAAAMADVVLGIIAQKFKNTFFAGARADDLAILVDDRLNIQRKPAVKATVVLSFSRAAAGSSGTIAAGTKVATAPSADGSQVFFTTDANIAVDTGTGPWTGAATCTVAGSGGNVAAGKVTQITTSLFDTFTLTNPADAGGGGDEEIDDELRYRAQTFFQTLRRATLGALEFGALQVASVKSARAYEDGTGNVTLRIADTDGNSTLQMEADVTREMEQWRSAGVNVNVVGGKRGLVTLSLSIYGFAETFDIQANKATIQAVVQARVNRLRSGETLYLDSIRAAAISVSPSEVFGVEVEAITLDGVTQGKYDLNPVDDRITLRVASPSDIAVA